MKFGGAAVASPDRFERIAQIIINRKQAFPCVVVVVSAMGGMTDYLRDLAQQVHPKPPTREMDMLLSVGERISIALLAMALAKLGQGAVSFTGSQAGIITSSDHEDALIVKVTPCRLLPKLSEGDVVIVAGFQGVSLAKEITTLGRGGSDTSAVAIAAAIGADKVEFYKDVPGVFSDDPKIDPTASHFSTLTYQEALTIVNQGAKILHPRAVRLAEKNGIPLHVLSFNEQEGDLKHGTWIGSLRKQAGEVTPIYEEVRL